MLELGLTLLQKLLQLVLLGKLENFDQYAALLNVLDGSYVIEVQILDQSLE